MHLCECYNLTLGIYVIVFNKLMYTDDSKTIKGLLGREVQFFLNSRKSFPYKCKLLSFSKVGDKLENGSYDGALGAIDKKKIDFFVKSETPFSINDNVILSYPVYSEEFLLTQTINKNKLEDFEIKMQLIRSFNFAFFFFFFLTTFLFFLTSWFFISLNSKYFFIKKRKLELNLFPFLKKINQNRIKYFCLVFFGLIIFEFFMKQIITNSIKTSKVIVDTSELITTEEKLFESSLKAAWFDGETDLSFVQNAPKNTFLNKLYLLKNENPVKVVEKSFSYDMVPLMKNYFLFMKKSTLQIVLSFLSYVSGKDGFLNEKPFYSIYTVFYITKGIKTEKIKYLYQLTQRSSQAGLISKISERMSSVKLIDDQKKTKLYTNLKSFIDDYTMFEPLKLENFYYIFLTFYFLNFLFYLMFIFSHLLRFINLSIDS